MPSKISEPPRQEARPMNAMNDQPIGNGEIGAPIGNGDNGERPIANGVNGGGPMANGVNGPPPIGNGCNGGRQECLPHQHGAPIGNGV
jgi:hypothetical protein